MHDNPVEPVSHETVPPLPATPDPPASTLVTELHLPSETDERYMLTKTRTKPKDGWLGYCWAITEVEGVKRFVAIYEFEPLVLAWISDSGIDVAFHLANLARLEWRQWTQCQIRDIEGLMYIKNPKLYFADIIAHNIVRRGIW